MKELYIGLDVHKAQTTIAFCLDEPGSRRTKASVYGQTSSSSVQNMERLLRKIAKQQGVEMDQVHICYEAGGTGFVLARHLQSLNIDCEVIAPSKIPKKPGDKVKNDGIDSMKLAQEHRSGNLTVVHIPDVEDEVIRDLCRARTDAVRALTKSKHQLTMFLNRNGHTYPGKTYWSEAHMRYLRELKMPSETHQLVLEECLMVVDDNTARVERFTRKMQERLETWSRKDAVMALRGFKGFDWTAAMVIVSELGDFSRFKHPRQLMGYLGMVPSEESSDRKRRQGSITKTGNGHARWMFVECAQHCRTSPKISRALSQRHEEYQKLGAEQKAHSREVKKISWRAQNRLYKRYHRLAARRLPTNKIIVAVARELSGFVWELMVQLTQTKAVARINTSTATHRPGTRSEETVKRCPRKKRSYRLKKAPTTPSSKAAKRKKTKATS